MLGWHPVNPPGKPKPMEGNSCAKKASYSSVKLRTGCRAISSRSTVSSAATAAATAVLLLCLGAVTLMRPEIRGCTLGEPEVPWAWATSPAPQRGPLISVSSPRAEEVIRVSCADEMSLPLTAPGELVRCARRCLEREPGVGFRLQIDEQARASSVVAILGALRTAGVSRVTFVVRQETVGMRAR